MDFGQLRQQQQQGARQMMYQNSGYQFERNDKKTLVLDIKDDGTSQPLSTAADFTVDLFEPLIIDKPAEVYLDNFSTFNSLLCDKNDRSAFSLSINEFNVNANVASTSSNQQIYNKILIPNEHNDINDVHSTVLHKGKKMNYVCTINPGRISKITGKITDLAGNSMFSTGDGTDGGKIHYVSLTSGASQHVDAGSIFGWDAGADSAVDTKFSTVFDMREGSTDLYFQSNGGSITPATFIGTADADAEVSMKASGGADGIDTKLANVTTYKQGDFPRFTAEFIIVSK